jgi:hypothetical protein
MTAPALTAALEMLRNIARAWDTDAAECEGTPVSAMVSLALVEQALADARRQAHDWKLQWETTHERVEHARRQAIEENEALRVALLTSIRLLREWQSSCGDYQATLAHIRNIRALLPLPAPTGGRDGAR